MEGRKYKRKSWARFNFYVYYARLFTHPLYFIYARKAC